MNSTTFAAVTPRMNPDALAADLDLAMPRDRESLRRLRRSIRQAQKRSKPFDRNQRRFETLLAESVAVREKRVAGVPRVQFDQGLPIDERREEIAAAIQESSVVIVCGETGSGKSTQLPKICLAAGRGVEGVIGHTQPRRIAARSIADRLSKELGSPLGGAVGYKVRFHDETGDQTYVKLMTDGILLAEVSGDPRLERYDTIIIDEAHERSLNIDFLLGLLRGLVEKRPDLRVIITSATIDAERFADHFKIGDRPAKVIEVSGRTYPVEVRYRPLESTLTQRAPDPCRGVVEAVEELNAERVGDTLVFLPTERDIRETARLLRGSPAARGAEVVPLYARLSAKEQNRVFEVGKQRRVVLATNVAESSLTVPGIRAVVDTGTARIAKYAARTRVQRLPIEAVSQASANQRAGRCGRIGPGICVRLYGEDDFEARPPFATPEIRRTNLAAVILRMMTLKLGSIDDFPLLDRPRPDGVREGYATLRELQAIDKAGVLTPLGERLGRLPVDPRVGRMILAAAEEGCLNDVLIIAAALEVQDPREQPADKRDAAREQHTRYADARSDFLGYLKLWDHLRQMREDLSRNQFRKACSKQFLSYVRILEWQDVHRQLLAIARQEKLKVGPRRDAFGAIHRSLLCGLLSSIGLHRDEKGYQTPSGEGFSIWPGAGPAGTTPKWIMAAEVVETSRKYLRTVARIRPEWLPGLAEHVLERAYREPQWSEKRQTVVAHQRLTLFSLPLNVKGLVPYGPVNPSGARDVFIREALVDEGLRGGWEFLEHNRGVIEELRTLDAKARRSAALGDETLLADFYAERLPPDVWDAQTFRRWFRRDGDTLLLDRDTVLPKADEADRVGFPDELLVGEHTLPLVYEHRPGGETDGTTLRTPQELLCLLDEDQLEWGVPGLLVDKLIALIRLLPKPVRTRLVPAPDAAARIAEGLEHGRGPFLVTVAAALGREAGAEIVPGMLPLSELPPHLRINVRVEDETGEPLAEGRDVGALRRELSEGEAAGEERLVPDDTWTRDGFTEWEFGELPTTVRVRRGQREIDAFPGLIDRGETVDVRLFVDRVDAKQATRTALRRLILLRNRDAIRRQVKWLPGWDGLKPVLKAWDPTRDQANELADLVADRALGELDPRPTNADEFARLAKRTKERIGLAIQDVTPIAVPILEAVGEVQTVLRKIERAMDHPAAADVRRQLVDLTPPGFWIDTPWEWLGHLPRYLRAIRERLRRVVEGGGGQDRRMHEQVEPHQQRLDDALAAGVDPQLESFRHYGWMLQEYRVSVFAQKLGASLKVSPKRLDEQWARVQWGE